MQQINRARMLLVILLIVVLTGCGTGNFQADTNYEVEDFRFTNQNNEQVGLTDLKGTVWIADFIFTNCETVCPPMTYNLTELQKKLKENGVEDYRIVSFSVDPEVDTPEALKEFIGQFEADTSKWDLLTGYSFDEISEFAKGSFKSLVVDDPNSDQMIHATSFYLVNSDGRMVKSYSGAEEFDATQMALDIEALIKQEQNQ